MLFSDGTRCPRKLFSFLFRDVPRAWLARPHTQFSVYFQLAEKGWDYFKLLFLGDAW